MIAIINESRDLPNDAPHVYSVQINRGPVIAKFQHRRNEPLSVCLRRAADAVEKAERRGETINPYAQEPSE